MENADETWAEVEEEEARLAKPATAPRQLADLAIDFFFDHVRIAYMIAHDQLRVIEHEVRIEDVESSWTVPANPFTDRHKSVLAHNLPIAGTGVAFTAIYTALQRTFNGTPTAPVLNEQEQIRMLVYMLRSCFAHDPMSPQWVCRGPFARLLDIPSLNIHVDLATLNGAGLNLRPFGGLAGIYRLMEAARDMIPA